MLMQNIQNFIFSDIKNAFIIGILLLAFIELIWIIVMQISLSRLKKKKGPKIKGDPEFLEDTLAKHEQAIKELDKDIFELFNISNQINELAFRGLHKVGVVRFNPFKDVGGDQSFAIALLNGKNSGLVLSSLYTREGTRIYSKSIVAGKSEKYPLTEEEEQAIKIAVSKESKKI